MPNSLRGDFEKLREKIMKLKAAERGLVAERITIALAKVGFDMATNSAAAGTNPQGQRWKRLRLGGGIPLRGAATSLRVRVEKTTFKVESSQPWLRFHQRGAGRRGTNWRLPVRRILPRKAPPKLWRLAMVAAADEAFRKAMR